MIVTVGARKGGGAMLVIGLPKRSQDYLRRGQPAVIESTTLAQAELAEEALKDTDVVIAFVNEEADLLRVMSAAHVAPQDAVTPADRVEDLRELVDGLLEQTPPASAAATCLAAAVAALAAAQREFRKEGA